MASARVATSASCRRCATPSHRQPRISGIMLPAKAVDRDRGSAAACRTGPGSRAGPFAASSRSASRRAACTANSDGQRGSSVSSGHVDAGQHGAGHAPHDLAHRQMRRLAAGVDEIGRSTASARQPHDDQCRSPDRRTAVSPAPRSRRSLSSRLASCLQQRGSTGRKVHGSAWSRRPFADSLAPDHAGRTHVEAAMGHPCVVHRMIPARIPSAWKCVSASDTISSIAEATRRSSHARGAQRDVAVALDHAFPPLDLRHLCMQHGRAAGAYRLEAATRSRRRRPQDRTGTRRAHRRLRRSCRSPCSCRSSRHSRWRPWPRPPDRRASVASFTAPQPELSSTTMRTPAGRNSATPPARTADWRSRRCRRP